MGLQTCGARCPVSTFAMVSSFPTESRSVGAYSLVRASSCAHVAASEANSDVGPCWQAAETLDRLNAFELAKKIGMKPVAMSQASFSTASTEQLLHWASHHPGPGEAPCRKQRPETDRWVLSEQKERHPVNPRVIRWVAAVSVHALARVVVPVCICRASGG